MTTEQQQSLTEVQAETPEDVLRQLPFASQDQFELNGTRFFLQKMPAGEGMRVFHMLRKSLADLDLSSGQDEQTWGNILQQLAVNIPEETFTAVQRLGFRYVRYTNENTERQVLAGSEDDAFDDALDIVDVWVRMVAFNFLKSLLAKIWALNQAAGQQS